MKFTLSEIYGLTTGLKNLTDKEIPVKIAFRLYKFLKNCSEEMEILEKLRIKLIEKHKGEIKEGKEIKVSDENKDKFKKDFTVLLNEEVEIEFEPILVGDLGDISISTNDIISLQKLFK